MEKILAILIIVSVSIFINWLDNFEPTSPYDRTSTNTKTNFENNYVEEFKFDKDWNKKILINYKDKKLIIDSDAYPIYAINIVHYGVYYKQITILSSIYDFVLYIKYEKIIKVEKNNRYI